MVSSSIVDKYIGESARLIREMFNYARDHQPCIIFMDEIDAIGNSAHCSPNRSYKHNGNSVVLNWFNTYFLFEGGRRFSEGTSADREIQRTLMEVWRWFVTYLVNEAYEIKLNKMFKIKLKLMLNYLNWNLPIYQCTSKKKKKTNWSKYFLSVSCWIRWMDLTLCIESRWSWPPTGQTL